jgi:hypothetical protein
MFTPEQASSATIRKLDASMTSDQYLYDLALRKDHLIQEMQRVLQVAAADCELHRKEHLQDSPKHTCIGYGADANPMEYAYALDNMDPDELQTSLAHERADETDATDSGYGRHRRLVAVRNKNGALAYIDRHQGAV